MEIEIKEDVLIFERAFDTEALSSFNCGIRELDVLIHKREDGLEDFIRNNDCDAFFVYYDGIPVAVFVYSIRPLKTEDGEYDATEIDFIAVRKDYREQGIGRRILDVISLNSLQNGRDFLTVGAFFNKKYSAQGFYQKCGFEQLSEAQNNIIPMFKELKSNV